MQVDHAIVGRNVWANWSCVVVALILLGGTGTGRAGIIPIADPNFNTPAESSGGGYSTGAGNFGSTDGWTGDGSRTGVQNASGTSYFNDTWAGSGGFYTPGGNQVGYANSEGAISQTLNGANGTTTATLLGGQVYILSGYIGNRSGFGFTGSGALVELLAGSTVIASETVAAPAAGSFATWSISYTVPASVPSNETGDLEIYLGGPNSGSQVNYGEISLSYSPVPEPVNVALGIFGGVLLVAILARSRPVRNRIHCWRVAAVRWIDAV
jgi:hypothetical protein